MVFRLMGGQKPKKGAGEGDGFRFFVVRGEKMCSERPNSGSKGARTLRHTRGRTWFRDGGKSEKNKSEVHGGKKCRDLHSL